MHIIQEYIIGRFQHCLRCRKNVSFEPNRKLFSQILTLKFLYPDKKEWEDRIMTELRALIEEYESDISLVHIGFPEDLG